MIHKNCGGIVYISISEVEGKGPGWCVKCNEIITCRDQLEVWCRLCGGEVKVGSPPMSHHPEGGPPEPYEYCDSCGKKLSTEDTTVENSELEIEAATDEEKHLYEMQDKLDEFNRRRWRE